VPRTVLELSQQIGGNQPCVRRVIRQHQQFTRTGQEINRGMADNEPLGSHNVGIAGTEDFLNLSNRGGAVRHCRNGLRAANPVNLRGARSACRKQETRVDAAILAAGRADDDLGATRFPREHHRHEGSGNQRSSATGNVDAHPLKRVELFTNLCPVRISGLPAAPPGFSRKRRDVAIRLGNGGA